MQPHLSSGARPPHRNISKGLISILRRASAAYYGLIFWRLESQQKGKFWVRAKFAFLHKENRKIKAQKLVIDFD
jgi:hypothetical protein